MAQNSWFYTFPNGKKYEIGIYHSQEGHVVIYCEGEILVIDFNVTGDKEYSFFIENKLLKISIELKNEAFSYALSEDMLSPIPSKATEVHRKYQMWTVMIFILILMLIFVSFLWFM